MLIYHLKLSYQKWPESRGTCYKAEQVYMVYAVDWSCPLSLYVSTLSQRVSSPLLAPPLLPPRLGQYPLPPLWCGAGAEGPGVSTRAAALLLQPWVCAGPADQALCAGWGPHHLTQPYTQMSVCWASHKHSQCVVVQLVFLYNFLYIINNDFSAWSYGGWSQKLPFHYIFVMIELFSKLGIKPNHFKLE